MILALLLLLMLLLLLKNSAFSKPNEIVMHKGVLFKAFENLIQQRRRKHMDVNARYTGYSSSLSFRTEDQSRARSSSLYSAVRLCCKSEDLGLGIPLLGGVGLSATEREREN